jgi:hypothetical protein
MNTRIFVILIILLAFILLKKIKQLKGIYEGFNSSQCLGKRDGVSGCRDCCRNKYYENYKNCVNLCMNY